MGVYSAGEITSCVRRRAGRGRSCALLAGAVAAALGAGSSVTQAQITITKTSNTDWKIGNGDLNVVYDPANNNITSVAIGSGGNLLDPNNSSLYPEFAGTPFGAGSQSFGSVQTSNYIDFWTTTASTGTTVNPITYSFHYIMFANDPDICCYEVLNHSATDPATSVGQGQFIARINTGMFTNSYQYNVGPNNLGPQTSITPPTYPADGTPNSNTVDAVTGRDVTNATYDLTGSGLPGDWGSNFNTKYDFASYFQFLQAQTLYGSQYAESDIYTSIDSINGGPTHQDLMSTNLALIGFLSGHLGDANYAYDPAQGVATSKLFGPFAFRFVPTDGETGAQLYTDAVNSMPGLEADYATDTELIANGYVPETAASRGTVQVNAASLAGWSSDIDNNTIVLSAPNTDFQESVLGNDYWAQVSTTGTASIANVVPGTYRMTLYELGQWGETRIDGVQVKNGQITVPQNVQFTPENFGSSIWTIGTPDRSDHEFLNGNNNTITFTNGNATATPITNNGVTPGGDLRQYYGNYNYWWEEQQLGTPGYVSYNATSVPSSGLTATNNPLDWIGNQWGTFDPGIYNPVDGTTDGYANGYGPDGGAPAYVMAAGGPTTYGGAPWQVNFTVTPTQLSAANYKYVDLSVGLASNEGSLIVYLNGHQEIWHFGGNNSDAMVRSGNSGTYEFLVFEFPIADLNAANALDQFTFSVSQADGDMYDALRMELSVLGANPSVTGWEDYYYITGANTQVAPNNAYGLTAQELIYPSAPDWLLSTGGTWDSTGNWANGSVPNQAGDIVTFGATITAPSTVTLDGNWTAGTVNFASTNSYTLTSGTGGSLTLNNGSIAAAIDVSTGAHTIAAPVVLSSNLIVSLTGGTSDLVMSGPISGSGTVTLTGGGTLTLSGSNSYGGTTSINAGMLLIGNASAIPANKTLIVGKVGSPAGAQMTNGIGQMSLSSLDVNTGSTLDITNNVIAINYGSPLSDPAGTIANYLAKGYNGGAWTGMGITSSTAAAAVAGGNTPVMSVGYADGDSDTGTAAGPNQVLVAYTIAGDANLDGIVNFADFAAVLKNFNQGGTDWAQGNFEYATSGATTNFADFALVLKNFLLAAPGVEVGEQLGGTVLPLDETSSVSETVAPLPEPTAATLLAAGACGLLARRRKRLRGPNIASSGDFLGNSVDLWPIAQHTPVGHTE